MKKIETFIFIHDQEIVLDFLSKNKFKEFTEFKYVFLGNGNVDKINHLPNLIISRDLPDNIEHHPKLTSFTGWYSLVKNNLINSEYVNFFEYDVNFVPNIEDTVNDILKNEVDFIGYFPMSLKDPVYVTQRQYVEELIDVIKIKTGVDVDNIVNRLIDTNTNGYWSSSSNSTWKSSEITNYVNWMSNFIPNIIVSNFCGHMHERSLSFYYFINNLKVILTNGLAQHFQLNSHKTSPLPESRSKHLYQFLK